jgi:hypothetical protein
MSDDTHLKDIHKAMFIELLVMLSASAMQHLGKTVNPLTGKTEVHLEAAQATIDLIGMLEAKTAGNLDPDEARFLKNTLTTLQMNYVETAQAQAPPAAAAPAAEAGTPAEPAAGAAGGPDAGEEKAPKFRKTYG